MLRAQSFLIVLCLWTPPAAAVEGARDPALRHDDTEKTRKGQEGDRGADDRKPVKLIHPENLHAVRRMVAKPAAVRLAAQAGPALVAVKKAVEQVRIVPFMKAMASGKAVDGVDLAVLQAAWQDKQSSQWIENEFRAERPDDHEWIPSNWMLKVVLRAQSAPEGLKWVDLQDQMRSATAEVLFKTSMASTVRTSQGKTYLDLAGHVGALDNATGGPLDTGQEQFHNELRQVFDSTSTLADCIAGVKGVVAKWVWDGAPLPAGTAIDPTISYHGGGKVAADPNLLSRQAANFAAINGMLDGVLAAVQATP